MATNTPAQPTGAAQGGNQQPQQPATNTAQPAGAAQARIYTRQEILRESLWITFGWTWFTTFVVRGAVPTLVATMAYDGYRLFPGAPPPPAELTLALFIIQFVTLDLGGLALEKRAKAAGFTRRSFPRVIALSLIGITLVTMISTGIEELWPTLPDGVTKGLAAALLIGRMVLTVFYCKAVDELDEVPDPGQVQPAPPVAPAIDYAELVAELVRAGLVVASKPVPPVVVSEVAAPQIAAPAPTSHEAAEPAPPPVASAPVVPDLAMTPKPESQKAAEPVPMALASVVAPKPVPTPEQRADATRRLVQTLLTPEPTSAESTAFSGAQVDLNGSSAANSGSRATKTPAKATVKVPEQGSELDIRLEAAYVALEAEGVTTISGRALAGKARCNRNTANAWLRGRTTGSESSGVGNETDGVGFVDSGSRSQQDLEPGHDTDELPALDLALASRSQEVEL